MDDDTETTAERIRAAYRAVQRRGKWAETPEELARAQAFWKEFNTAHPRQTARPTTKPAYTYYAYAKRKRKRPRPTAAKPAITADTQKKFNF